MNTIKKGFIYIAFLFAPVLITLQSCNNNGEDIEVNNVDQKMLKEKFKSTAKNIFQNRQSANKTDNTSNKTDINNMSPAEKTELALASLELIKSYGLTESEIEFELEGITEDKLIESSLAIVAVEEEAEVNNRELIDLSDNTSLLTGQQVPQISLNKGYQAKSQVVHCALEAIGINAIGELINNGIKNMPKSAVKKVLKKVATRYLGYVGAAIAVYEFGDCMDWW